MTVRRSPRNIRRVDYTGMDTIEPECEFDGITNIWADETIHYDPDYVPPHYNHKTSKNETKSTTYLAPLYDPKDIERGTNNIETKFSITMQNFMNDYDNTTSLLRRISIIRRMYKFINTFLPMLLNIDTKKYIKFTCIMYEKMISLEADIKTLQEFISSHDKHLATNLFSVFSRTRQLFEPYISAEKNNARKNTYNTRRLRNIPPVNYRGMDTIEPECEFDGITDIWFDTTIHEDPDYTP